MDENEVTGTARDFIGKAKEGLGSATGDEGMRGEGMADQVSGKAQKAYGAAKDAISDAADAAAQSGVTQPLLDFVKSQPVIALLATATASYMLAMLMHSGKR